MRELIFRTYKRGVMYYIVELPFSEQVDLNGQIDGLIDMDYKVMQYIGLNDTNNIRIYEGDIISIDNPMYDRPMITDVFFDRGAFRYRYPDGSGSVLDMKYSTKVKGYEQVTHNIEVLGNIYENPELLKAK